MEHPLKEWKHGVSEKQILAAILEYLQIKGYFCWRNNTGGFEGQLGNFYRFGYPGSGDILGLTRTGRFFSIEVKRENKRPTETQLAFMDQINNSGGLAFVAYSIGDVEAVGL